MTMVNFLSRSDIRVNRAVRIDQILRHEAAAPPATAEIAAGSRTVVLRDGSTVLIRQVQADDAPLLADGFARLSAESRATRCLGAKKELSSAELRYLRSG